MLTALNDFICKHFNFEIKQINTAAYGIALFIFYIFTQRWFELYLQVRAYQVAVASLALFLIFIGVWQRNFFKTKLTAIDLLWLLGVIVIITNILLVGVSDYYLDFFVYGSSLAFLVLTKVEIKIYKASFLFIKAAAIVYAAGSIFQMLFTDFFNEWLFKYTTSQSQDSISRLVTRNYYPGLGFGRTAIAAGYIATGIGLLAAFFSKHKTKVYILFGILIISVLFFGLLVTGKRSVFMWTLIALPFSMYVAWASKLRISKLIAVTVALLICLVLFSIALDYFDSVRVLPRLDSLVLDIFTGEVTGSIGVRIEIYQRAWAYFLENPVFGVGWKQFEELVAGTYSSEYDVHNLYLQLLAELGIVGAAFVLTPLFYTYIKTFRMIRAIRENQLPEKNIWWKGLVFSFYYQTFFLLYCLADSILHDITYILTYFVAISIINSYLVLGKDEQNEGKLEVELSHE